MTAIKTTGPSDVLTEPGSDLIAIQAGQGDIEQQIGRSPTVGDIDRLTSVVGGRNIVAEVPQQACHALRRVPVVIDDQDVGDNRYVDST